MLTEGTVIYGQYQVLNLLTRGGMSYIHNAKHLPTGKQLVIKEAMKEKSQNDRMLVQNLVMEGNLLKRLNNPHLPRIYEVIEYSDQILIIMDYVEGEDLYKVLKTRGPIPMKQVIDYAIQICDVFQYLHTQNPPIIYRDMKPSNVILQSTGNIMMIDFGTARTWKGDAGMTSDTVLFGTEGFAAPEQFGGMGESDSRTDIFCIGATLFNLVTNHDPYTKPYGVTPLGEFNAEWKDCPLDLIIRKCTERDPDNRYQSVSELKAALLDAASRPLQKAGFLSKLGSGTKTKSGQLSGQGWSAPSMSVSDGYSQELIRKNIQSIEAAQGAVNNTMQHFDPGTEILKDAGPRTGNIASQQPPVMIPETGQEPAAKNLYLYRMLMLIALVLGIGFAAITIVLLLAESTVAIGSGVFAFLSLIAGFVFAGLYLKG